MSKTYRELAIEHLKVGNLCKGYIDYIVGEVEKLEKIEQIINEEGNIWSASVYKRLKEILEKE